MQALVDENSKRFRDLVELLHISADTFIRTILENQTQHASRTLADKLLRLI